MVSPTALAGGVFMRPKTVLQRRKKSRKQRYVLKRLQWSSIERQIWLDDVMKTVIDLYVEQEGLVQELPLFDNLKKSK